MMQPQFLGRVAYLPTYEAMQAFTLARTTYADQLWVCEHDPVYTQGLAGKRAHFWSIIQSCKIGANAPLCFVFILYKFVVFQTSAENYAANSAKNAKRLAAQRLANIIRNDENVTGRQVQQQHMSNKMQAAAEVLTMQRKIGVISPSLPLKSEEER